MTKHEFRVKQDGMVVAWSSSELRDGAASRIAVYASQYVYEGDVEVQEKISKRWKTVYKLKKFKAEDN